MVDIIKLTKRFLIIFQKNERTNNDEEDLLL